MAAPAAALPPPEPFPLTYATLMKGYREAERLIAKHSQLGEDVIGTSVTGRRMLGWNNPIMDAAILHVMSLGMDGDQAMELAQLATRIRRLAMFVMGVAGYDQFGSVYRDTITNLVDVILQPDEHIWMSPDMCRFLLRVVPRARMDEFIQHSAQFGAAMARAREDLQTRTVLERAQFGKRLPNDLAQIVARKAAPSAVTLQRPLQLIDTAAQRARDAPHIPQTNMNVLEDIIATFDDDPAEAKRKLIDLQRSVAKRFKLIHRGAGRG